MDTEVLELIEAEHGGQEYSLKALQYGDHSLYSFDRAMVDVKDVLAESYVGRHSPAWLISHGFYPVYVDELVSGNRWF